MKSLQLFISPISWVFQNTTLFIQTVFLLQPSFVELLVLFVVDTIGFLIASKFVEPLFIKSFPSAQPYFYGYKDDEIANFSLEEKEAFYKSTLKYPLRRAIYAFIASYIKAIPGFFVVTFYWQHETSNLEQLMTILSIATLCFTFFTGAIIIESHIFLSKMLREIHEKFNWTDVFRKISLKSKSKDLEVSEILTMTVIIILTLTLQWVVISSQQYETQLELALKLSLIGVVGLLLFVRIWYLGRKYFTDGLEDIFKNMAQIDYKHNDLTLPLHSSILLARFEQSFNLLLERLRGSEKEISTWVLRRAEKERFRAIGEMSSLIAHDLTNPIHVIKFCVDGLVDSKNNDDRASFKLYSQKLAQGSKRALELLHALRARLRNVDDGEEGHGTTYFIDGHQHVLRFLDTEFRAQGLSSIDFKVDEKIEGFKISIPRVDFTQILDNIYRNSIKAIAESDSEEAIIQIEVAEVKWNSNDRSVATFHISDTGSGLSIQAFEEMTTFQFAAEETSSNKGLGLKLTKRMIEMHGGSLQVASQPALGHGTTFILQLPVLPAKKPYLVGVEGGREEDDE